MAAGLGFKTFTSGEVLTAADTNGYLMQGINVFANASARSAAITSPQEGQYSFLKDTNALEYYDGAAWVGAPVGDITAVTAGKGLTGGGSSGDVTVSLATTAKGDLVAGSGASTAAVLTVGLNGETLVADSSTATGLRYQGSQAAAKNILINGGFDIWQRGTSSTLNNGYGSADRWYQYIGAGSGTYARESTVVPAGAQYSLKFTASAAGTSESITQYIETANAIFFSGKTVTISGQFAASTSVPMTYVFQYATTVDAGTGAAWTTISAASGGTATPTSTTFVTMTGTYAVPSVAQSLRLIVQPVSTIASGVVVYHGLIQIELGSVATAFTRAGGTIQGELAACQRYYYQITGNTNYALTTGGNTANNTNRSSIFFPVEMRIAPTGMTTTGTASDYAINQYSVGTTTCTAVPTFFEASTRMGMVNNSLAAATLTTFQPSGLRSNATGAFLGWSAEL